MFWLNCSNITVVDETKKTKGHWKYIFTFEKYILELKLIAKERQNKYMKNVWIKKAPLYVSGHVLCVFQAC